MLPGLQHASDACVRSLCNGPRALQWPKSHHDGVMQWSKSDRDEVMPTCRLGHAL